MVGPRLCSLNVIGSQVNQEAGQAFSLAVGAQVIEAFTRNLLENFSESLEPLRDLSTAKSTEMQLF